MDDFEIQVSESDSKVTLSGTVTSWYQKEEAGSIAWFTPGTWHINYESEVDYCFALIGQ